MSLLVKRFITSHSALLKSLLRSQTKCNVEVIWKFLYYVKNNIPTELQICLEIKQYSYSSYVVYHMYT